LGLPGRRVAPRNPVLAALGRADQAVLRFLRTRGHQPPVEAVMRALGAAGEYGAVWAAVVTGGAAIDGRRRRSWAIAGALGPAAVGINFIVKVAVGRERPLIEEHPPLAPAPTKLSFPSAHATSSVAAATALGRVEPKARLPLGTLAALICVGRPYLGMHYPSDVIGGVVVGFALGALVPGLRPRPAEERLIDLAIDANRSAEGNGAPEPAVIQHGSRPT
jgi:membrane-associated phospholipid phosphatase